MHDLDQIFLKEIQNHSLATSLLHNHDYLVVYGCGGGFNTFFEFVVRKLSLEIDLIIDKKFSGKQIWRGFDASDIDSVEERIRERSTVVITIGSRETRHQVKNQLLQSNFKNVISAFDFYEYHLSHADLGVINGGEAYYKKNEIEIKNSYELLNEAESRTVFKNLLEFYYTRAMTPIKSRPFSEQYLPEDINLQKGYSCLLNCGAFDGDTIKNIHRAKGRLESIICIEPNLNNFSALTSYLKENPDKLADEIIALPIGISSRNNYASFSLAGTNSNITPKESTKKDDSKPMEITSLEEASCVVVKLDSLLIRKKISFINMDIEGSELDALQGLRNTIKTYKPDLAISIYHEPAHLWQVALFIHSLSFGYEFFLRNYSSYPAETVLYATTNQN